ncbi:hypothetical protein Kpol_1003p42 [Vanderwaltozyma polyspora DSM 70294]|uniref:Protein ICE2 n=1 Tax=Vanderwaltozyma polyspora (strain ATCC 22028 / DSM 70294 / BCRC 21397 / CBS 2163 / NBRC 10782 / NRRL Y-8283 / UCD 57-17) TaxID=436907 RepID=A7TM00_VANPO|nr:uncharacterized protein Kpol_1003p42 [Vanderwaltozyma polyspora DSM 70294]EDO16737.1 hypothetical protein Kpol_1003p42 [Vanderwaltozyma polyspora DSM 70294]
MRRVLKNLIRSVQVVLVCFYLLNIVTTIPISFKIGGLYCGLTFTVTLFYLYFTSTTLNIIARRWGSKPAIIITSSFFYFQNFIIPSLLHLFLNGFANEDLIKSIRSGIQPKETFLDLLRGDIPVSVKNWLLFYYYYSYTVKPWQVILSYSTPVFTLLEGFFTILGIQTIGEMNTWLKHERNSNIWIISSLLTSGGLITGSLYYLYRIYATPIWNLSVGAATLLGFTLSLVGSLGIYGIVSHNGSVIESSLFFAYIVRCIYEIAPELATTATEEFLEGIKEVWQSHHANLNVADGFISYFYDSFHMQAHKFWTLFTSRTPYYGYLHNYCMDYPSLVMIRSNFYPIWETLKTLTFSVPTSISELFHLTVRMAIDSVSPAIIINLCFRLMIFYSATRIIPAIQKRTRSETRKIRGIMKALYWYSPCILIAMYTHLILQYSGELKKDLCLWGCDSTWFGEDQERINVDAWSFWNWCNIFWTIIIYGSELIGGKK